VQNGLSAITLRTKELLSGKQFSSAEKVARRERATGKSKPPKKRPQASGGGRSPTWFRRRA